MLSLEDKTAQSRTNQQKLSEWSEQARMDMQILQQEMEDVGRKVKEEAQNEVELKLR